MDNLFKSLRKLQKAAKEFEKVTSGRHPKGPGQDVSSSIPNSGKPPERKHIRADTMTHQDFRLEKGSKQRRERFNPDEVPMEERRPTEEWTSGYFDDANREDIPRLEGNARSRGLHKLHSQTQVRKNPETGEREFLLYRGRTMADINNNGLESLSSFTPDPQVAKDFNRDVVISNLTDDHPYDHFGDGEHLTDHAKALEAMGDDKAAKKDYVKKHFGHVYKAWVPESAIHHIPNAIGSKSSDVDTGPDIHTQATRSHRASENEVIVDTPKVPQMDMVHRDEIPAPEPNISPQQRLINKLAQRRKQKVEKSTIQKPKEPRIGTGISTGISANKNRPENANLHKSTPRKQKNQELKEEAQQEYVNARRSKFQNVGEDIKSSARHKAYEWKGLQQAEDEGRAAEFVNFKNLIKFNPADLTPKDPSHSLSALASHFALQKFPKKVEMPYGSGWHTKGIGDSEHAATEIEKENGDKFFVKPGSVDSYLKHGGYKKVKDWTAGDLHKQWRAAYSNAFDRVKGKAEELAHSGKNPNDVIKELRDEVHSIVTEHRQKFPGTSLANAFIDYHNKNLHTSGYRPKGTSAQKNIVDFITLFAQKYNKSPEDDIVGDYDNMHQHAIAVTSGKSIPAAFDAKQAGKKQFDPTEFYPNEVVREGPAREWEGSSSHSHHLMELAKMRGLQYGNSVTDSERAFHLEQTAHALKDLADVTGLPDQMMSFNGRLGLAFGARGKKRALAHYEPDLRVINLTRKNGIGSLAHEWGHMFDHLLPEAMGHNHGMFTSRASRNPFHVDQDHPEKKKIMQSMKKITDALNGDIRSRMVDAWSNNFRDVISRDKMSKYWLSDHEMFARAFERYVDHKLQKQGRKNTYLAGVADHPLWTTKEEDEKLAPLFDELFNHFRSSEYLHKSIQLLNKSIPQGFVYVAMDGDNAGAQVEKAALKDDLDAIKDISERIKAGSEAVRRYAETKLGAKTIIFGGDDIGFLIPRKYWGKVDELRALYHKVAGFTITAGIADSIPDATKALLWGKMHGKDQSVLGNNKITAEIDSLKGDVPIDPKQKILESGVLDKSYADKKFKKYSKLYKDQPNTFKLLKSWNAKRALANLALRKTPWKDKIAGGLADKKKPADFGEDQLRQGVMVELEHTNDWRKAMEIAMDHLMEDSKYYDKLKTIEPQHKSKKLQKAFLQGATWIPEKHDKDHPEDERYRAHVNTNKTMAWSLKPEYAKQADAKFAGDAASNLHRVPEAHQDKFKRMVARVLSDRDRHARTRFSKSPRHSPVPDVKLRHIHSALRGHQGNHIRVSKTDPNKIYITAVRHGKGGPVSTKGSNKFDVWSYDGNKFQYHDKPNMADIGDHLLQNPQQQVSGFGKLQKSLDANRDVPHVATIGIISGNSILMGRRNDNGKYTTPGGHLNPNEKPEAGAFRELMEEANIKPDALHYLGSRLVKGRDGQDRMVHAFTGFGQHNASGENDPDKEVSKWEWIDCSKGLPKNVRCNLHSPKNVLLHLLGVLKWQK